MKIEFTTTARYSSRHRTELVYRKRVVTSREECLSHVEQSLWDMHIAHPSEVWLCGDTTAHKIKED